jgi:hypothetical protein
MRLVRRIFEQPVYKLIYQHSLNPRLKRSIGSGPADHGGFPLKADATERAEIKIYR